MTNKLHTSKDTQLIFVKSSEGDYWVWGNEEDG